MRRQVKQAKRPAENSRGRIPLLPCIDHAASSICLGELQRRPGQFIQTCCFQEGFQKPRKSRLFKFNQEKHQPKKVVFSLDSTNPKKQNTVAPNGGWDLGQCGTNPKGMPCFPWKSTGHLRFLGGSLISKWIISKLSVQPQVVPRLRAGSPGDSQRL